MIELQLESKDGVPCISASNRQEWRAWLDKYGESQNGIWLIIYHKGSGINTVFYDEAVEEGLCYDWIDSKPNKRDDQSYYQYFSPRNPKSNWSRKNKQIVEKLILAGKMATPGMKLINLAKKTGTWDALNDVEDLVTPPDLAEELLKYKEAKKHFDNFPPSVKRGILEWIFNAKRETTRLKRIRQTASLAQQNIRANQYRK